MVKMLIMLLGLNIGDTPMCQVPCPTATAKPLPTSAPVISVTDKSCSGLTFDPIVSRDANGWSILPVPARAIYVSKDYANKPAEGAKFYVTNLSEGVKLLRQGQADYLLFKKGETFNLQGGLPQGNLGGPDSLHPMLIGSFGTGARPILNLANGVSLLNATAPVSNLMFQSLDIRSLRTDQASDGIRYAAKGGKNWILEDVRMQGFLNNLDFDSQFDANGNGIQNLVIRRSQILDAYSAAAEHSQNVYLDRARGVVIEESVFDHGGWKNRGKGPGRSTVFNHNLYIQTLNKCVTFRGNVSMRGSATGLQMRAGGIVEDNLFLDNPMHLTYGAVNGGSVDAKDLPYGVSGRVGRNVFLNGTDLGPDKDEFRTGQSEFGNILNTSVTENLVAHHTRGAAAGTGFVIRGNVGIGIVDMLFANNVIYDLGIKLSLQGNAWGAVNIKTDGSVWKNGKMVITAAASGMALPKALVSLAGQGLILKDNILQTGSSDFLNLVFDNPDIRVVEKQTAPVKFLEPNRQPAGYLKIGSYEGFLAALRDKSFDPNWSAKSINAWVKAGYQTIP